MLVQLDNLITDIASEIYRSVPIQEWRSATMYAKYTPDASVSGHDFDYVSQDGAVDQSQAPSNSELIRISKATRHHWQLTQDLGQPRWYKMTVTVERTGQFSVDFEYKDDYQVGDIMKRG
jgi:Protein of unknown function, DUF600